MKLKQRLKRWQRKILAPFDSRLRKLKFSLERFVIKTVTKHGLISQPPSISQVQHIPATLNETGGTVIHVVEPSKQLLALLKTIQRSKCDCQGRSSFKGIPLGNGMLLVEHPHAGFMYADTANVALLPNLVMGDYQTDVSMALERSVKPGDLVLHIGAKQGYHLLTLAHLVGPQGHVVSFESSSDHVALSLNVTAHSLVAQVTVCDHESEALELTKKKRNTAAAIVFFVEDEASLNECVEQTFLDTVSDSINTTIVIGSQIISGKEFATKMRCQTSNNLVNRAAA